MEIFILVIIFCFCCALYGAYDTRKHPEKVYQQLRNRPGARMICPHCQTMGGVITEQVKLKKGISGGKATGAILTGGISLLATGLSRKEDATKAKCLKCGSVWHF